MQIWNLSRNNICTGSSLGGFSVAKHLYSLEIALYCYKELRRNILDFWSRFKTKNLLKLHILRLHTRSAICIRGRDDLRKARSNFTASQIDQSDALSLFQPTTNNGRAWSRAFSSPEAALLLVSTKNRDLWPCPTTEVCDSRMYHCSYVLCGRYVLWRNVEYSANHIMHSI